MIKELSNQIFILIKENKFKNLEELINKNDDIDLDIHDENYNYVIHYLINFNQESLVKLLLQKGIRLDILDIDGRNILYYPIKYNYSKILNILLEHNKKNIGIPIIDIKDSLGNTALHYAVILNNLDIVKILISFGADPLIINNENDNVLQIGIKYNRNDILEYLIENQISLNFVSSTGESFLQIAISFQNNYIINLILKRNCSVNNQEKEYGISALHQTLIQNNIKLSKELIKIGANINLQDFYGNTPFIYCVSENNNNELIEFLISFDDLNYNITNIDGNTALHIILSKEIEINKLLLEKIILKTDLTIQNNYGESCLQLLLKKNLFITYSNILISKELNIFIKDNDGISAYEIIEKMNKKDKDYVINTIIESYYSLLIKNKDRLKIDWEIWCGNNIAEKIKNLSKSNDSNENKCKDKIKEVIYNDRKSIPFINNLNITVDNGIVVKSCSYTGSTIDILFGLLFLYNKFNKEGFNILINETLVKNNSLITYYKSIGIDLNYKLDFINFEIIWTFQKIFFPIYFEENMKKLIKKSKFIVLPIGIETSKGSHANILFFDVKNKILERFEPNGSNEPKDLNYNSNILDHLILNKFKKIDNDIIYKVPKKYLPVIGFQIIENFNENKCKKIGDPNGFCGIWCIWWIYQKMKYYQVDSSKLSYELIKEIKYRNINFKDLIRNFSKNITDLRDSYLKKYDLDINDWIVGNYTDEILNKLDKSICKDFI
jgi:ankyrin repeat protein